MPELKDCPFCGCTAKLLDSLYCDGMKQVECTNCGALSMSHKERVVIAAWNNRVKVL